MKRAYLLLHFFFFFFYEKEYDKQYNLLLRVIYKDLKGISKDDFHHRQCSYNRSKVRQHATIASCRRST